VQRLLFSRNYSRNHAIIFTTTAFASCTQAQDVELQFASFADVTLVVSFFEAKEVADRVPKAKIEARALVL